MGPLYLLKAPLFSKLTLSPQCGLQCALTSHQIKREAVDYQMGHWPGTIFVVVMAKKVLAQQSRLKERFMRDEARRVFTVSPAHLHVR